MIPGRFSLTAKDCIDLLVPGRIHEEAAARQSRTSVEIERRLETQPGVILADEVGMGKTFIALAVAAETHFDDPRRRPVVIMVPSALVQKWPRDAKVFKEHCLRGAWREEFTFTEEPMESGVELLRTLGDGRSGCRYSIVFAKHGALYRSLGDGWVKLAILRQALYGKHSVDDIRLALSRYAGPLLRMSWIEDAVWAALLAKKPEEWPCYLEKTCPDASRGHGGGFVPPTILDAINHEDSRGGLELIRRCLKDIPRRESESIDQRILDFRRDLTEKLNAFWDSLKGRIDVDLPLLIFDEAHHLKNSRTRLVSSLFGDVDNEDKPEQGSFFDGVFARMLFLTATPFQLGHHELLDILKLFSFIDWRSDSAPAMTQDEYAERLAELSEKLDAAQRSALILESAWGRLRPEDHSIDGHPCSDDGSWLEAWEKHPETLTATALMALRKANVADEAMRRAETALRPWIIRHLKPRTMRLVDGEIERRAVFPGDRIISPDRIGTGLEIHGDAQLPFLLAARTVALTPRGRAVYAEGLSSSYEAFLNTHRNNEVGLDSDEESSDIAEDGTIRWYVDAISDSLRMSRARPAGVVPHPKIEATVGKTLELWRAREKILVFCHYIETGKVVRDEISAAIRKAIIDDARAYWPDGSPEQIESRLEEYADPLFKEGSKARASFDEQLYQFSRSHNGWNVLKPYEQQLHDIVRRFVRTPSFLVRYFDLGERLGPEAIRKAFGGKDASGMDLAMLLENFLDFLTERCDDKEREDYLEAVSSIQTGAHRVSREDFLDGEDISTNSLPNVRLVNGRTGQDARQKLMLTFNTPFFPEVLVTSSVLAEGVDLHLNCRHVIHHDLCWNPSTLEQRTGRIDRIGAKAERCGMPIEVYLPYIAGTQDEKMYRVMLDRERWFKVVMGGEYQYDTPRADEIADRVPLPLCLAEKLSLKLEC